MKRFIATYTLVLLAYSFGVAQNKIEIRVNDVVQNSNHPISVSKPTDKIELRVYTLKDDFLIDSLRSEGCGIKTFYKKRFVLFENRGQQRQISSTKPVEKKDVVITHMKPVYNVNCYSFRC